MKKGCKQLFVSFVHFCDILVFTTASVRKWRNVINKLYYTLEHVGKPKKASRRGLVVVAYPVRNPNGRRFDANYIEKDW